MSPKMSRKHLLGGLAAVGVLSVGLAAPAIAAATTEPSASASTEQDSRERRHAERQAEFAEALAKELGVPTEKVTTALEKLREQHRADRPERGDAADRQERLKERLDQAVKDGKLTQEQADAITKAFEAGVFPGPGGHGGMHGGMQRR